MGDASPAGGRGPSSRGFALPAAMPWTTQRGSVPRDDASRTAFATAGGEMAALINSTDWATTSLGQREELSQSLTTILRILVTSRYAMWLVWGKDLTFFYNGACAPTLGVKHPRALGQPASLVWAEIWARHRSAGAVGDGNRLGHLGHLGH
jgi:hypothetical protein